MIDFLYSLVPVTQWIIDASFLKYVYADLHNLNGNSLQNTNSYYFTSTFLHTCRQTYLQYWYEAITIGLRRQAQTRDIATIGISWGDMCGNISGGTTNFVSNPISSSNDTFDI